MYINTKVLKIQAVKWKNLYGKYVQVHWRIDLSEYTSASRPKQG